MASAVHLPPDEPPFSVKLPNTIWVFGQPIRGELTIDYRRALEENLERVVLELRGTIYTESSTTPDGDGAYETSSTDVLHKSATLWRRTDAAAVRLPFEFALPADLPPAFAFACAHLHAARVRYALVATGFRAGLFARDRTVTLPLAAIPADALGAGLRARLKAGWPDAAWGRLKAEREVRRHPWSAPGTLRVELLVPHIDTFPLFTPVPYTVVVRTLSARVRLKGDDCEGAEPFPPPIRDAAPLAFALRRAVDMRTPLGPSAPEEHVADVLPVPGAGAGVEVEVGERVWVPEPGGRREGRGRWAQAATFRSRMFLRCSPSFVTEEVKVKYVLCLKCEFPGAGNCVRIELPINVGSGAVRPISLAGDVGPGSMYMLDLPP
ncbi:uncharacterized protein BXZ73DRAFT_96330 [Epithele typhae]|uniref:uncharacterized protein n=1 Tax=Epithele typhae TaxID=378194 RepID=UPI0020078CF7|nr:uncharacterized protein BXZ73DRAFT_96330 [Epithele typhae]KAH9945341.1 hypothetical protein BXZ73DRAFT_96330 [Epithele typhae]